MNSPQVFRCFSFVQQAVIDRYYRRCPCGQGLICKHSYKIAGIYKLYQCHKDSNSTSVLKHCNIGQFSYNMSCNISGTFPTDTYFCFECLRILSKKVSIGGISWVKTCFLRHVLETFLKVFSRSLSTQAVSPLMRFACPWRTFCKFQNIFDSDMKNYIGKLKMIKWNRFDTDCKNERDVFIRCISFTCPLPPQCFHDHFHHTFCTYGELCGLKSMT